MLGSRLLSARLHKISLSSSEMLAMYWEVYSFRCGDPVHLSSAEDNTTLDSLLQYDLDLNWALSTQSRAIAISAIAFVRKVDVSSA